MGRRCAVHRRRQLPEVVIHPSINHPMHIYYHQLEANPRSNPPLKAKSLITTHHLNDVYDISY
jgi:hypothetical protein